MNKIVCNLADVLKMVNTAETGINKPKNVMTMEGPSAKKSKKKKLTQG